MSDTQQKTIAVFCGRDYGPNQAIYQEMALRTGRIIVEHGFRLASGGGPGMMSDVNKGGIEAGGTVISIQYGFNKEVQSPFFTESELYDHLVERQKRLIELADGMMVLPGGLGTIYEAIQVLALKRSGEIPLEKPIIFVGDGYYKHIEQFLTMIYHERFLQIPVEQLCTFATKPEEAVDVLAKQLLG